MYEGKRFILKVAQLSHTAYSTHCEELGYLQLLYCQTHQTGMNKSFQGYLTGLEHENTEKDEFRPEYQYRKNKSVHHVESGSTDQLPLLVCDWRDGIW